MHVMHTCNNTYTYKLHTYAYCKVYILVLGIAHLSLYDKLPMQTPTFYNVSSSDQDYPLADHSTD